MFIVHQSSVKPDLKVIKLVRSDNIHFNLSPSLRLPPRLTTRLQLQVKTHHPLFTKGGEGLSCLKVTANQQCLCRFNPCKGFSGWATVSREWKDHSKKYPNPPLYQFLSNFSPYLCWDKWSIHLTFNREPCRIKTCQLLTGRTEFLT